MTSLENILFYYNSLDPNNSTKAILRLMLANLKSLEEMNIQQFADLCYTSPSTISRITKAMGFRNFYSFRSEVATCLSQYRYHNRFCAEMPSPGRDSVAVISDNMEYVLREFQKLDVRQFEKIAEAMHRAESVTIFAYNIMFMENVLQSDLIFSGKTCEVVCGDYAQQERASSLKKGDFALFLFPEAIAGITPLRKAIETAIKQQATTCIFSSSDNPYVCGRSDYWISFSGKRHMVDSYFLELLLNALAMVYRDRYLDHEEAK